MVEVQKASPQPPSAPMMPPVRQMSGTFERLWSRDFVRDRLDRERREGVDGAMAHLAHLLHRLEQILSRTVLGEQAVEAGRIGRR